MAIAETSIELLADQLVAARNNRALAVPSSGPLPSNDAEAYRVQKAVAQRLGAPALAWKVGAAHAEAIPNCAPIFAVHTAGTPIRVEANTGVEVEIAFKLGRAFAAAATPPARTEVEAAITSAHVVLEVCASRLADGLKAPPHLQLADNGSNLGLIVGPSIPDWRRIDWNRLVTRLIADGTPLVETTGGHTTRGLPALLHWLVGHVVTERGGLAAGTIVTCGSWMGIRWVAPPATVKGVFDGVGELEARLAV
jgi:2-keto-4-pentenoate hydratase